MRASLASLVACAVTAVCFAAGQVLAATAPPHLYPLIHSSKWPTAHGYGPLDVAANGKYSYVTLWKEGLAVIDTSDSNCVRVGGYVQTPYPGDANAVVLSGNYAFVADGYDGLQVIDVSNPTNCVRVGHYVTGRFINGVAVAGNYAYVTDGGSSLGTNVGLQVIDVRNPTNCVLAGGYDTGSSSYRVVVSGNYAYVMDRTNGFQMIDVSNPTNCVRVPCPGSRGSGIAVAGHYVYTVGSAGLQVIDVSKPTNCIIVGTYDIGGSSVDVAVWGRYAYVAKYSAGLQVIDVSDPAHCVQVGNYDTGGRAAYGVAVADGRICVADFNAGLIVLRTLTNMQFTVRVEAEPGVQFTIETATDFSAPNPWAPIFRTNVPTMPFDFVDYDVRTATRPQKFYRVRQP